MTRPPGIRLHPRTMKVQGAEAELRTYLLTWQHQKQLTDTEMLIILDGQFSRTLIGLLRAERHPRNPGKKADEA